MAFVVNRALREFVHIPAGADALRSHVCPVVLILSGARAAVAVSLTALTLGNLSIISYSGSYLATRMKSQPSNYINAE